MASSFAYMWLWVICAVIFTSVVIIIIFIFINRCISRGGKHRVLELQRKTFSTVESNNYQERTVTPPLPPRTQFFCEESQSYENLAEQEDVHDYEEAEVGYEQAQEEQFDYVKVEDEQELFPPPPPQLEPDAVNDDASTEDYDDIGVEGENEEEEDYDDVG